MRAEHTIIMPKHMTQKLLGQKGARAAILKNIAN